jgi:hypothetical protein
MQNARSKASVPECHEAEAFQTNLPKHCGARITYDGLAKFQFGN